MIETIPSTFRNLSKAWVEPEVAPFYVSPFARRSFYPKNEIEERRHVLNNVEAIPMKKIVFSVEFFLFLTWVLIGNLDVVFTLFTYAQFAQYVQEDYKGTFKLHFSYYTNLALVDNLGSLAWTGAIYAVALGFFVDSISSRLKRPPMQSKIIVVAFLIIFDHLLGLAKGAYTQLLIDLM